VHGFAQIFESTNWEWSDSKVGFLENIYIFVFYQFFHLFDLFTLVWSQCFDIDLLEDLLFNIFYISADRGSINFFVLSFEGMSEIVDKINTIKFFLFGFLVKGSNMLICDSTLLVIMQKDLFAEIYIYFLVVDKWHRLFLNHLFEVLVILDCILMCFFYLFGLSNQTLLIFDLYLQIRHSWKFELVFNIGLLDIVHHNQVNQMA